MSTKIQDWFCFNQPVSTFPHPYNTLSSARLNGFKSQYTNQTTATRNINHCTLSRPPIEAMHKIVMAQAFKDAGLGDTDSGVGRNNQYAFAQYKVNEDDYRLAAYSFANGLVLIGKYNGVSDSYKQVDASNLDEHTCTAIFMALYYVALGDSEFQECFDSIKSGCDISNVFEDRQSEMGILCDNLYRRLTNQKIAGASILINETTQPLTRAQITQGRYIVPDVFEPERFGNVNILAGKTEEEEETVTVGADASSFVGKYAFKRVLTDEEKHLIPALKPHLQVPEFAETICQHIQMTTDNPVKMRNFMLRGVAGTGKTTAAQIIAAGLNLPYGNITCSADTQIFDLLGSIIPDTNVSLGNDELDAERQKYVDMGGINYKNISKMLNFPDFQTVDFDPESAYLTLTGVKNENATAEECIDIMMQRAIEKTQQLCVSANGQVAYKYVETQLVKAIRYGWVCEVQEPTVILQQGVLVGLNSLLEQDGMITLPTGEVIKRHPDAVIILTTNVAYEGCRAINQSVTDRMSLIFDIPNPNLESMVTRALKATGCTDEKMVRKMAQCVLDIEAHCKGKYITDGSVGVRGLLDWVNSYMVTKDALKSAEITVLSKATANPEDRESILNSCIATVF